MENMNPSVSYQRKRHQRMRGGNTRELIVKIWDMKKGRKDKKNKCIPIP